MYTIYDDYELDMEELGRGTLKEVKAIGKQRVKDTDGECYLIIINDNGEMIE